MLGRQDNPDLGGTASRGPWRERGGTYGRAARAARDAARDGEWERQGEG